MVDLCSLYGGGLQAKNTETPDDYLVFRCGEKSIEGGKVMGELVLYLSDTPPWGHFQNRYYKIVSVTKDYITGLSLNGQKAAYSPMHKLPGGEILVVQLSTGLVWISTIRQFMQPYGLGMQAFSYTGKCQTQN